MLRSANAAIKASEVSGDGGTGEGSGSTKLILQASLTPFAFQKVVKHQCTFAGRRGHLYGAPHTPINACPCVKRDSASRSLSAPALV